MKQITDIRGVWELSNSVEMPYLGLGVYKATDGKEVINAIHSAFDAGYRHIDTAAIYFNEEGVGKAVNQSFIDRKDIFVTSKVWNNNQGYKLTLKAFDESMKRLNLDYLDLYLVHWPVVGKYKETWKALEYLYKQGRVRAIGVSNFLIHHLDDLLSDAEIVPMVNQVEFHPRVVQQDLLNYCALKNIQFEAWSPLMQGEFTNIDTFKTLADKYSKTPAQIILRWNLQKGVVTIPKSVNKDRIFENGNLFDFELSVDDISLIDSLDRNERMGAHPDSFSF